MQHTAQNLPIEVASTQETK